MSGPHVGFFISIFNQKGETIGVSEHYIKNGRIQHLFSTLLYIMGWFRIKNLFKKKKKKAHEEKGYKPSQS